MPASLRATMADHDRGPQYAFVECVECTATARIDESAGVSNAVLQEQFEALGWSINPTLCPDCRPGAGGRMNRGGTP